MKEGSIHIKAIIAKTNESSFSFPTFGLRRSFLISCTLGFFAVVTMWNNKIDFKLFESLSKLIAVMAYVHKQSQRALLGAATAILWDFHRFKRFFSEVEF